jgi:outer membrane protein
MKISQLALIACAGAAALAFGAQASAQAAAPASNLGPAIPGICVFDFDGAAAESTLGKYVDGRIQQIGGQVNAELNGERSSIESDAKALDAQRTTLDQNTLDQRAAALQVRDNAWQRKAQLRQREMQATEQQALGRIANEMQPFVQQIAQQKGCGLVLARSAVLGVNPQMDISPAVVTALNGKITQFAFDRVHLDQPQAAGGAAPPVTEVPPQAPSRPAAKRK